MQHISRPMKRFSRAIAWIVFVILSSGCLYNVNKNAKLSTLSVNHALKGVETGSASIFMGANRRDEYRYFSRELLSKYGRSDIALYEDEKNIYFQYGRLYGLNTEIKKRWEQTAGLSKIPKENIECSKSRSICTLWAKKSHFIITMKKGYAGNIDFEYINLKPVVKNYHQAVRAYDESNFVGKPLSDIEPFIEQSVFIQAIEAADSRSKINILKMLAQKAGYKDVNYQFDKKLDQIEFESSYKLALKSSLDVKKAFVKRYANGKKQGGCYQVNTGKLNIRKEKSTNARIVGSYRKGETVCVIENNDGWSKTDDGWVATRFLGKKQLNDYQKEVAVVEKMIFNQVRDATLSSRDVAQVLAYKEKHPKDQEIFEHLLSLYRSSNTFDDSMKAYEMSQQKTDIKSAFKLASTNEQKKAVEIKLLESLNPNKFVNFEILESNETELKESKGSSLVHSFKGMARDYHRKIQVTLDKNAGIPFKYADYEVKIKLKLNMDYSPPINGKGKDFEVKEISLKLTPENNYTQTASVLYKGIAVHGEYHMLAGTMLSALANMFGANTSKEDLDIQVKLNGTKLSYEIVTVSGV